jgi:PBP1b-binding outer membrane lipoprotein LpoB
MKMKLIFALAALTMLVSSCSKESDTDSRDQFVGSYRVALTATTTGDAPLAKDTVVLTVTKNGAENLIVQTAFSVQSSFTINMELTTDSVFWHRGAAKNALFKITEQPVKIANANAGSVKGEALGTSSYHGSFSYVATSVADAADNSLTVNVQNISFKVSGSVSPQQDVHIPITVEVNGKKM